MVQKNLISECPKEHFERYNASLNGESLRPFLENNEMVKHSSLRIYFIHMKEIYVLQVCIVLDFSTEFDCCAHSYMAIPLNLDGKITTYDMFV